MNELLYLLIIACVAILILCFLYFFKSKPLDEGNLQKYHFNADSDLTNLEFPQRSDSADKTLTPEQIEKPL